MIDCLSGRRAAWPFAAFFLLVFVLLLVLNCWTPTWGDDWHRTVPLAELGQMFGRIRDEYLTWTGRASILATTFAFLAMWPGSLLLFNVVNSLMFCVLLAALFRVAVGRWPGAARTDLMTLLLAWIGVWFFTQSFGEAVLWKTGAIAYLWVMVAALLFMSPYLDVLLDQRVQADSRWRLWLWPLGAFWLGMALENVSVVLLLLVAVVLVLARRLLPARLPRWYAVNAAALLAGAAVLFLAPGNAVRFAMQDDHVPMTHRLGELLALIWQHVTQIAPIGLVLALLLVLTAIRSGQYAGNAGGLNENGCDGNALKRCWVLLVLGTLLALAMVGSTGINFAARTAFPAEVLWIAAALALAHPLWAAGWRGFWHAPLLLVLLPVLGADVLTTLEQGWATRQQTVRREALMAQYQQLGLRRILLPSMQIPYLPQIVDDYTQGRYFLRDIHGDMPGNGWRNGTYGEDHGFEFATRLPQPHVLLLPEVGREKVLASGEMFVALLRDEPRGWRMRPALYLLMPRAQCPARLEVRWLAADKGDLPLLARQQGYVGETLAFSDNVAVLNAQGQVAVDQCAWRIPVPEYAERAELRNEAGAILPLELRR